MSIKNLDLTHNCETILSSLGAASVKQARRQVVVIGGARHKTGVTQWNTNSCSEAEVVREAN